ncbi:MAG: response regulator [Synechococcus sp.]
MSWTFFFYYGRIMFASGGPHPVRQWLALLQRYTDDRQRQQVLHILKQYSATGSVECWQYEILYESLKRESISRQQLSAMCQTVVYWSIFDIWQSGNYKTEFIEEPAKLPKTVLIDPDQAIETTASEWSSWDEAKILNYRPNIGVKVIQADRLKEQTPPKTYRSMERMLDGNATLREIAAKFKRDVKPFVQKLAPFVERGILAWQAMDDLPCPVNVKPPEEDASPPTSQDTFTIACIDDSRAICEYMRFLVDKAGFNYISISNPLEAMEVLLEKKPNLIFLDLVMPNTSGYEVCSQFRRHEDFKHIPIIILTGNDGIVDRVRAKMVGATDFLGKPLSEVDFERVIQDNLFRSAS